MRNIERVSDACTGCGACAAICSRACIHMQWNIDGFAYPAVDSAVCIHCGKCLEVCPACRTPYLQTGSQCMGAISKYPEEIQESASGGVFYTLGKWFLEHGGIVCGAVMGKDKLAVHKCTETLDGLRVMQGSKYVQSSTADCFRQIRQYINEGRMVLFSGTPCQVAGLYACVGQSELLWTADVVCHGVPSPVFLQKHIEYLEAKNHKTAEQIRFRSKDSRSRTAYRLRLFQGDSCWYDAYYKNDLYYNLFMEGITYRESCYTCPYAEKKRIADLTIGDLSSFRTYPAFHPDEATSVVILNSERGVQLWEKAMSGFDFIDIQFEKELTMNHQLSAPAKRPPLRDHIYTILRELPEEQAFRRYCTPLSFRERLSLTVKQYLPVGVVKWIRNHC